MFMPDPDPTQFKKTGTGSDQISKTESEFILKAGSDQKTPGSGSATLIQLLRTKDPPP